MLSFAIKAYDQQSLRRLRPSRGAQIPRMLDAHYETMRRAMQGVSQELGLAA
jgi:hypothetical protein